MNLQFLIPSQMRRRVLACFVKNPQTKACGRELARQLTAAAQLVYRELLNLEAWGLLLSTKQSNQRIFYLNERFPLYPPIRDLFTIYEREESKSYQVVTSYKLADMVHRLRQVPTPPELIPMLKEPRVRPRAFEENKLLKEIQR